MADKAKEQPLAESVRNLLKEVFTASKNSTTGKAAMYDAYQRHVTDSQIQGVEPLSLDEFNKQHAGNLDSAANQLVQQILGSTPATGPAGGSNE